MKHGRICKRLVAACLAGVMVFSMAACGGKDAQQPVDSVQTGVNGFVYTPEFISLSDGSEENRYYGNRYFGGGYMYFSENSYDEETQTSSVSFLRRALTKDAQNEELPITMEGNRNVQQIQPDKDGNLVMFLADYSSGATSPEGYSIAENFLVKYDAQGNLLFEQNITEIMNEDQDNSYIQYIALDQEGRIYASANNIIRLFGSDGTYQGKVDAGAGSWISGLGAGKDGKVYYCQYSQTGSGMELIQVDFDTKASGASYQNFMQSGNIGIIPGVESDFLTADSSSLYEYDLATQTSEKVLDWLDSDINGSYVRNVSAMEDGRLIVYIEDWETNNSELAYLTKTEASQVAEKTVLTLAALSVSQWVQTAAVKFNKSSDKYRIKIKQYIDYNQEWTENTWSDAIQRMNSDLISGGNAPDIVDLSDMNISQLVSKGLIEDLGKYLDESTKLKREDFVENILDNYTVDDVLACIPTFFVVQTIFGPASEVGTEMGWTIDELMAYADKYPEAEIFEWATSDNIVNLCLANSSNIFIDWVNAKCNFDTDEFRKVLEFAKRFPTEFKQADYSNEKSTPKKIQDGEVLLYRTGVTEVNEIQVAEGMFGEPVTAIGYPTVDGSAGSTLLGQNVYGIISKSDNKEGAWEFLESILSDETVSRMDYGFSSRKSKLEKTFEDSMKVEYVLDENGEPILDENDEPILMNSSSYGWGDWEIQIKPATQEQVDMVKAIIEAAKPAAISNQEVMDVISEEAAPFFAGQKTMDEVIGVIQSRVQLYLSENS